MHKEGEGQEAQGGRGKRYMEGGAEAQRGRGKRHKEGGARGTRREGQEAQESEGDQKQNNTM